MKRLLVAPICLAAACTITITPLKKQSPPRRHIRHSRIVKPSPTPSPISRLEEQIHKQYEPIYEKLPEIDIPPYP